MTCETTTKLLCVSLGKLTTSLYNLKGGVGSQAVLPLHEHLRKMFVFRLLARGFGFVAWRGFSLGLMAFSSGLRAVRLPGSGFGDLGSVQPLYRESSHLYCRLAQVKGSLIPQFGADPPALAPKGSETLLQ